MRGTIFVWTKRPGNFGPVFLSRLPVLVTLIGRLFFLLVSVLDLLYTKCLTDFLTGLLHYEDVYIVIAKKPSQLLFNMAAHSSPMTECFNTD